MTDLTANVTGNQPKVRLRSRDVALIIFSCINDHSLIVLSSTSVEIDPVTLYAYPAADGFTCNQYGVFLCVNTGSDYSTPVL
jgi:hypothetical protein